MSDIEISKKMAALAIDALEDRKGEDIRALDISEISTLADYFIIAAGTNRNQVQALADSVQEKLGRAGHMTKNVEGYDSANWILLDFGDPDYVLPYNPLAYLDRAKDKIGYEIPFTRLFYKFVPPTPSEQIFEEIKGLEAEETKLMKELFGNA